MKLKGEDKELIEILKSINLLISKANKKLIIIHKFLKSNEFGILYTRESNKLFEEGNEESLKLIKKLTKKDKALIKDEKKAKKIFSSEIKDLKETTQKLILLENCLENQLIIFEHINQEKKLHNNLLILGTLVKKEIELLNLEGKTFQKVRENISILRKRMIKNTKLPIIKHKKGIYYHISPFTFKLNEKLKSAGYRKHRIRIEKRFEQIRKKKYPYRPSRRTCKYVSKSRKAIKSLRSNGIVYVVEVKGKTFMTDMQWFTEACYSKNKKDLDEWIEQYWEGSDVEDGWFSEILVDGEVKIIGLAENYEED